MNDEVWRTLRIMISITSTQGFVERTIEIIFILINFGANSCNSK